MLPSALTAASFSHYPPEARSMAMANLATLQAMPLAFLPSLLQELIEYDYKFPAERAELDGQLARLAKETPEQRRLLFADFAAIRLSPAEEKLDWVNQPLRFTEQVSAYLWSTHQMDAFRAAATGYGRAMQLPPSPQAVQRLGIAVVGQGTKDAQREKNAAPLFEKLRPAGTYFSRIHPDDGLSKLLKAVEARAEAHPAPFAHWYVDGGTAVQCSSLVHRVSYDALAPVRNRLLERIQQQVSLPGMGPERLHDYLGQLTPEALGMQGDPVLERFKMKLLTEGSGTQIFSTTFAQWTAREVLRRAQASTLLVRFAPRQRQRSMSELLTSSSGPVETDPAGSLIDAQIASYYHWLNQQRLPGYERSAFLAWYEGHSEAVLIGPSLPRGVESKSERNLGDLLKLATS